MKFVSRNAEVRGEIVVNNELRYLVTELASSNILK